MIKDTNNIPEAIQSLNELNGSNLRAGVLDDGKEHMIAHVQEYGATITPKNGEYLTIPMRDGSFRKLKSVTIPARPFIAQTVLRHSEEWGKIVNEMAISAISGKNVKGLKKNLADKMALDIKTTMFNGDFKANAPITIANKNGSRPLIDTGALQGAVRGEVEK
ncbi:hypothetical protein [Fructobacillus tropaeoli]|uniref:Uncharacterized protein n=1 Tax=Fructobacillus tropaeoli TaxID=709323 RepID=A0ABN9YK42_9LACO|nr:hypothetical protein [Fructobacillus tropaeoli]GIC70614.1 hypothetical protein FT12353_12900 [Fructobacillus tropaeoli]CAK1228412.1 hypothetical protein R53137_KAKDMLNK_00231 [Fructobacillus tropaeoli]CAK1235045.1 hypothetical protein LMG30238_FMBOGHMB_00634 [Fructobacillus tropaeoli]